MLHSIVRIRWIPAFLCVALFLALAPFSHADLIEHGTEEFCQLSGFVYHDFNNNGTRDATEMLLPDVEIKLVNSVSGETFQTTFTGATTGTYCFTDIPAGVYTVIEVQPEILHSAMPNPVGTAGGIVVNSNKFDEIVLTPTIVAEDYNFGELGLKARYMSKRHFIGVIPVPVPEPAALGLLGMILGGATLYVLRRRSSRK